ncbi:MAG: hypothetical protein EA412_00460, partial [Chitinophagaceae bacterium]
VIIPVQPKIILVLFAVVEVAVLVGIILYGQGKTLGRDGHAEGVIMCCLGFDDGGAVRHWGLKLFVETNIRKEWVLIFLFFSPYFCLDAKVTKGQGFAGCPTKLRSLR